MAALSLGSNNFAREASVNPPEVIKGLAERMKARGIKPELEAFEPGMVCWSTAFAGSPSSPIAPWRHRASYASAWA